MTRLTEEERKALFALNRQGSLLADPADEHLIVASTPEARMAYIRFATMASQFFRGEKEIGFKGDNWRL